MKKRLKKRILVVDDERDILELVAYNLKKHDYTADTVASGEEAVKAARNDMPDLIVLDLMLPGIDGLDVCRILKGDKKTQAIPILMLTAKGDETDIVRGLEIGADDYVTKPFSPRVLVARVQALLRRGEESILNKEGVIVFDALRIHPGKREVIVDQHPVELTYTEYQILYLLASHPSWVFTRDQIIEEVRGENYMVTDRTVDFQIVGLRKKLGMAGKFIKTVRGVGYRFNQEE